MLGSDCLIIFHNCRSDWTQTEGSIRFDKSERKISDWNEESHQHVSEKSAGKIDCQHVSEKSAGKLDRLKPFIAGAERQLLSPELRFNLKCQLPKYYPQENSVL